MVRLKDNSHLAPQGRHLRFNSTMVRLKADSTDLLLHSLVAFQFHNGSIKRPAGSASPRSQTCFNSTMVRLKAGPKGKELRAIREFQFHNGSIKR